MNALLQRVPMGVAISADWYRPDEKDSDDDSESDCASRSSIAASTSPSIFLNNMIKRANEIQA